MDKFFILELPIEYNKDNLTSIKYDNLKLTEDKLQALVFNQIESNSYGKSKVVMFETNGKLRFKEVGKFIKAARFVETKKASHKNVILTKRKK